MEINRSDLSQRFIDLFIGSLKFTDEEFELLLSHMRFELIPGVSSISVSEKWAGSRFRPEGQSKRSGTTKDEIRKSDYAGYINVYTKSITLPGYIKRLFKDAPKAFNTFQELSYSNKKEYLLWIFNAKQEKTRNERLAGFIKKLAAEKRTLMKNNTSTFPSLLVFRFRIFLS